MLRFVHDQAVKSVPFRAAQKGVSLWNKRKNQGGCQGTIKIPLNTSFSSKTHALNQVPELRSRVKTHNNKSK